MSKKCRIRDRFCYLTALFNEPIGNVNKTTVLCSKQKEPNRRTWRGETDTRTDGTASSGTDSGMEKFPGRRYSWIKRNVVMRVPQREGIRERWKTPSKVRQKSLEEIECCFAIEQVGYSNLKEKKKPTKINSHLPLTCSAISLVKTERVFLVSLWQRSPFHSTFSPHGIDQ